MESGNVTYPHVNLSIDENKVTVLGEEQPKSVTISFYADTEYVINYTLEKTTTWDDLINNYYSYFETDFGGVFRNEWACDDYYYLFSDERSEYVYFVYCDGYVSHFGPCSCGGTEKLGILTDENGNYIKRFDIIKSGNYTHLNLEDEIECQCRYKDGSLS